MNWNISGSGTIAATSFSYVPSYPNLNGAITIPDTVSQANGMNISIGALSNITNSISLTVLQNTNDELEHQRKRNHRSNFFLLCTELSELKRSDYYTGYG